MRKTAGAVYVILFFLLQSAATSPATQDDPTHLRMNVVLVQLSVAVTDSKGKYVTGLRPEDFEVSEDKIPQKVSSFEEGSGSGTNSDDTAKSDQVAPMDSRPLPRACGS